MKPSTLLLLSVGWLLGCLAALPTIAQTTWTGSTNSNWATPTNWNLNRAPTALDDVVIPGNSINQPILSTTAVVKSVEVQQPASLTVTSTGSLSISGSRVVQGASFTAGFVNRGRVVNGGKLVLGSTSRVGDVGLFTTSAFTNLAGGLISIDGTTSTGLDCRGSFTNVGSIAIGDYRSVGGSGLYNAQFSTFNNVAGSTIRILATDKGLFNEGIFNNSGGITIGENALSSKSVYGLFNTATFSNLTGGEISTINSTTSGLYNQNGIFINNSDIYIGIARSSSSGSVGDIALTNASSFSNLTGGKITINRGKITALSNSKSFANAGSINIGTSGIIGYASENGLVNVSGTSSFSNLAEGKISINEATKIGLNNEGNFANAANITISSNTLAGQIAVKNSYRFFNSGCKALLNVVADAIITNNAYFNNEGLLIENALGNSAISNNPGVVVNNRGGNFATGSGPNKPLSVTSSPPTSGSYNGSFRVGGLRANTTYTISLSVGSYATALTTGSDVGGRVGVGNLRGGVYKVVLSNACLAQALPLSFTFTTPTVAVSGVDIDNPPPICVIPIVTLVASEGGTLTCGTTSLSLTALAAEPGLTYEFSGPNGFGSGPGSSSTITISADGTYIVLATEVNGCTASASTQVFSNTTAPTAELTVNDVLSCAAPTVTLTASDAAGLSSGTYAFDGPDGTSAGLVATAGNSATVNSAGTYSVTVLNPATGCLGTATVGVTGNPTDIIPAPTLPISQSVVCEGSNVQVVATVSGSLSGLRWYKDGQAVLGQSSATLTLSGVVPAQAGSYVLMLTGNCSNTSTPFSLTVQPAPAITLQAFPPTTNGVNLLVTGGTRYEWLMVLERLNGFEIRQTQSNTTGLFTIDRPNPFRITVTDGNGCQTTVESNLAALYR